MSHGVGVAELFAATAVGDAGQAVGGIVGVAVGYLGALRQQDLAQGVVAFNKGKKSRLMVAFVKLTTLEYVDINVNMKAKLRYRFEQDFEDGAMVRMVIWEVLNPVPPSEHGHKYRLVYLENDKRIIGFDNERGKGDHRHDGETEFPYRFVDVPTLINDFIDAVRQRRKA